MISKRIKAVVLSAVMTASVFITPAAYQFTQVSAASVSVNHKYVTTESEDDDATNKAKIDVKSLQGASTLTFNFKTDYVGDVTIGAYGGEISEDPYWFNDKQEAKLKPDANGEFSFVYEVPAEYTDVIKTVGIGVWYPKDGEVVTLTSVESGGDVGNNSGSGEQEKPVTENTKSGNWSFVDNKDGTATISSTLTAEINDQEMDYLLTAGFDEESYIDPETGSNTYEEGQPINAKKFKFSDFGLEDLSTVTIESFNYTITSDEEMDQFMYGGGINVEQLSPADTEAVKGKDGYWYNDQGEEDMEEYGDLFEIEVKNGYTVQNAGSYVEVVWDVPAEVQPYVSKNVTDTVGFQFWYADAVTPREGEDYSAIEEVHLKAASCTYTRTMTVPYNKTVNKKIGEKLTPGSDEDTNQVKYYLSDLGLENRDLVSAVKFNVTSSADLTKFTGGVGVSVANGNPNVTSEGWYMPANITVLEPEKTFEIMWIIPETLRKDIDVISEEGNLMFGAWYAGEEAPTITLNSIDVYEFMSNEEDLVVEPTAVEIAVGETYELDINVDDCTFVSSNSKVAVVENGVVEALAVGNTNVIVRTPEGQETTITVRVTKAPEVTTVPVTTPAPTTTTTIKTTAKPVTTKPVTTTVDPDDIIDWDKVMYGDVNLDTKVNVADVVALNMYLLNSEANKLNATQKENAQCVYDDELNASDSSMLMNYVSMMVTIDKLGPQE